MKQIGQLEAKNNNSGEHTNQIGAL